MNWLSKSRWGRFFKILTKKEKIIFSLFLFLFIVSFSFLLTSVYLKSTKIVPAEGGVFVEGVVGYPSFINPIYAAANDVDRDLTELIFSGLMKYDLEGKIVPDLAENLQISEEGKIWEISLKEKLFWSDGHCLNADDVIFTIETIQNPEIDSPLRPNWLGVKVEKISDSKVRFILSNPSGIFLENLTLKIIPKHIWENTSPQNFRLSIFKNLNPIGSGPYRLKEKLTLNEEGKIAFLNLIRNPYYYGKKPNFKKISFLFFENEEDLIKAAKEGKIDGFSLLQDEIKITLPSYKINNFVLPRYFAVFFNLEKSKALNQKEVRQALNYGTNKKEIVEKILNNAGEIVESPILPEVYGFKKPEKIYQFDLEKGNELLEKAGFLKTENGIREKIIKKEPAFQLKSNLKIGASTKEVEELQRCLSKDKEVYPEGEITGYFGQKTKEAVIRFQEKYADEILKPSGLTKGTGEVLKATRNKLNEICFQGTEEKMPLKFSLITVKQPLMLEVATFLKENWQKLGVELKVEAYDISFLKDKIINPREYDIFLFGEVLGLIPDPFPFWHSSQKKYPGLNLSLYENKESDKLIEEARQTLDEAKRREKLEKFQEILIEDAPSVFLYNPNYLYFISNKIKGVKETIITDPSKRFINIENWYINTKRVWK